MWYPQRLVIAIALVAVGGLGLRHGAVAAGLASGLKADPFPWTEMDALDKWNPCCVVVWPDGTRHRGFYPRDGFSRFCYLVFVDPGPHMEFGLDSRIPEVSQPIHQHFAALSDACVRDGRFADALWMLFDNVEVFARSLPHLQVRLHEVGALSRAQRAPLLQVASDMRRVMHDPNATEEVKAAAHLVAALTGGAESRKDTVSTRELARLPKLWPKQRLTSFLSQYYLCWTLMSRGHKSRALQVAKQALSRYSDHAPLRDLDAYHIARSIVQDAQGQGKSKG
jgi:hypothetical protein